MSNNTAIQWFHNNFGNLEEKYAGKYIGIEKDKVIAVGDSVAEVYAKLKLLNPKDEDVLITFIDHGDLHAYHIRDTYNQT